MNKTILTLLIIIISSVPLYSARYELEIDKCLHTKAMEIAGSQIGVTELTGKNDGVQVEKYLKVTGLPKGYPYCAAGISWCFYEAAKFYNKPKSFIPFPMTAGSQVVYDYAKKNGMKTKNRPSVWDIFCWRKKDHYTGHVGIIDSIGQKGWVYTTEFNTSNGKKGSQRDGGGVYNRKRNVLHPLGKLMVRGFIGFKDLPSDLCNKIIVLTKSEIYKKIAPVRAIRNNSYLEQIYIKLFG